jgi:dihydrofolate synthase/folylpolyglutamate synthase
MRTIIDFAQAETALAQFVRPDAPLGNYTLEIMSALMAFLGNPQDELNVIHIAGTSGKTSTAYYVTSLLTTAGYMTGLSISPHIKQINERAQINLLPLPEAEYCEQLATFLDLVDESMLQPSHFELMVAFAYWLFHKLGIEYAIIEVGLGGLLDGTNVVRRPDKIGVITDIGLDHVEVLGDTLAKIAAQKAGIIHYGNDVLMYEQSGEIMAVVKKVSRAKKAKLHVILDNPVQKHDVLPLFQQRNFYLAVNVVRFTLERDGHHELTLAQLDRAAKVHIPGRMDVMSYHGKTLILDGAHNEQKITALVESIEDQFAGRAISLMVAFGQNKQSSVHESLKLLRRLGSSIIVTSFIKGQDEVRRPIDPTKLAELAAQVGFSSISIEPNPFEALKLLEKSSANVHLIAGSFYLLENLSSIF